MILASHNSWTFTSPTKWYMRPFAFMARCQRKDILAQFYQGVRMFDLRLHFDKYGKSSIRHGSMEFNHRLYDDLDNLDSIAKQTGEKIYVRVFLEQNYLFNRQKELEGWFSNACRFLHNYYIHIIFIGGVRKFDEKSVYEFGNPTPHIIHAYSSTTSMFGNNKNKWYAKLDDFWPWLYAKTHNKKNLQRFKDSKAYLMLDFI